MMTVVLAKFLTATQEVGKTYPEASEDLGSFIR